MIDIQKEIFKAVEALQPVEIEPELEGKYRWRKFDGENPEIYHHFDRVARGLIKAGIKKMHPRSIMCVVISDVILGKKDPDARNSFKNGKYDRFFNEANGYTPDAMFLFFIAEKWKKHNQKNRDFVEFIAGAIL